VTLLTVPITINGQEYPFDVKKPGSSFNSAMADLESFGQDEGARLESVRKDGEKNEEELNQLRDSLDRQKPRSAAGTAKRTKTRQRVADLEADLRDRTKQIAAYNDIALEKARTVCETMAAKPEQFKKIMEAYNWTLEDLTALIGGVLEQATQHYAASDSVSSDAKKNGITTGRRKKKSRN
jgi:chromosome segregation ATPase